MTATTANGISAATATYTANTAAPIHEADFEDYYRGVPSWLAEKRALYISVNKLLVAMVVALIIAVGALGTAIRIMVPLKTIMPFALAIHDDESIELVRDFGELTPDKQKDAVIEKCWQYTRMREEWHNDTSQYTYDLVRMLTSGQARNAYEAWMIKDPQSPYNNIGPKGDIYVYKVPGAVEVTHQTCVVPFSRMEQTKGGMPGKKERWTATIGFQLVTGLDAAEKMDDAVGWKVISYNALPD